MMSISPERGQEPYLLAFGSIQIAGQSQSPSGSLAVTSTRPYLMLAPFLVLMRPDLAGGITVSFPPVKLVAATQLDQTLEVQVPSLRRLITLFFCINFESCRVALMTSLPSST